MFLGYANILYPLSGSSLAGSVNYHQQLPSGTQDSQAPLSTACGDVIGYANENINENFVFNADDVYECLASVPFNDAVATRFIDYYNTTLQFQSTLAYLKNPPEGYQQPKVDVQAVLQQIKQNITTGQYVNQYDFETTVQALAYSMHDSHVTLDAGIMAAFSWGSPYDIMAASSDGKQPPQVYFRDDIIDSQLEGWDPSPITAVNGVDTTTYLKEFAALNSPGFVEDHAEWNALMYNPVQDILGTINIFGWDATFYPGSNLTFTFANGTVIDTVWLAFYRNFAETGPLTTGGDFYNYFVLGLLPASFNDTSADAGDGDEFTYDNGSSGNSTGSQNQTSWYGTSSAFPETADVVQPALSVDGTGYLTGYFYSDISTGVLSIPSFDEYGDDIGTFSNTTAEFIQGAKDAGLTRIVIDLQQNSGGTTLLAIDTFKQFFPDREPFAGSRRRSHQLANVVGSAITEFWSSLTPDDEEDYADFYELLAANEWVLTDRLNAATGKNFTSWAEYYGPISAQGDYFSLIERYNLSSEVFDSAAFGGWIPAGYAGGSSSSPPPWEAENIVLLTDGTCASACALLVEMMTFEAGVRTVAVGGTPSPGPMQSASGTRGASVAQAEYLDDNFVLAGLIDDAANATLPPVRDSGMWVSDMGFNHRDQMRQNEEIPLQFQYLAADCRIYFTLANAYNMSRLWRDAARATWDDSSLCVEGSTGYSRKANSTAAKSPPQYNGNQVVFDGIEGASDAAGETSTKEGLSDGYGSLPSSSFSLYNPSTCYTTKWANVDCKSGKTKICIPACDNNTPCPSKSRCVTDSKSSSESKNYSLGGGQSNTNQQSKTRTKGYCVPAPDSGLGCPRRPPK